MPKINLFKKLSLIFLSSILFLNSMAMPFAVTKAAEPAPSSPPSTWYNQGFTDWYAKVYGDESPPSEIFGERYTAAQVQWILYSLFSFPVNILGSRLQSIYSCLVGNIGSPIETLVCFHDINTIFDDFFIALGINLNSTGMIQPATAGQMTQVVFSDYQNRPLSGINYVNNNILKFISVPEANAQGFGYGQIEGLQKYWQGFRDVSYAISVLVVIIFAFMIMFRVKLSPQLVISVQSALPKIIGALILSTFSYAIAGFVIDLSYVVGGIFASLMNLAGFQPFEVAYHTIIPSPNEKFGAFFIVGFMGYYTIVFFIASVVAFITSFLSIFTSGSILAIIMSFLLIIFTIWILCLMIWYTIKVPWVLLKNLVSLFLSIVVAPIQIVVGAIAPSIGFSVWLKKIVAETMVFPLVGLFMFLAIEALTASIKVSFKLGSAPQLWSPSIIGNAESLSGVIWIIISFMFVTMIPKAVDIMKMLIMNGKFDFGSAIGEAMQPGNIAGGMYVGSQLDKTEALARKRGTTGWDIASREDAINGSGIKNRAKYVGLSGLQKLLSGKF